MLTLYHHNISVCAQKVRVQLAEKRIPYEARHVDLMKSEHLQPAYLKINPKGLVPALVHDGAPVTESTVIMEYIEDVFPEPPLRPAAPLDRAHMRQWAKVPDEGIHIACASVTYAAAFAEQLKKHHSRAEMEERLAKLPDQKRAERQRQILERGFEAPFVRDAVLLHDKMLADMEKSLADGPWLAGQSFSLGDIAIIPYVTRLDRLGLDGMWAGRPRVTDWFARVQARPSFAAAITAFQPDAYDDQLRKQGIDVWPQVKALLAA
ncbi:MAG: glutathione S-transferase family protein [Candidatus Eiseniibacteriota bacterium]